MPEEIDASIITSVKELFDSGYYEEEVEEKLKKMAYSEEQIKIIFQESKEIIDDRQKKLKRMQFVAIMLSFAIFVLGAGVIALIQVA